MSKFSSRINKLITKTHNFISHNDHCAMRDYFKMQFDEVEKTEDFEEKFQQYLDLAKKYDETKSIEIQAQIEELMKSNNAILFYIIYKGSVEMCEEYPNGDWVPKYFTDQCMKTIKEAKRYLKAKQSHF